MSRKPRIVRTPFSFLYNRLYRYVRNHYRIELYYTRRVDGLSLAGERGLDARLLQGAMETIGRHDTAAAVGSAVFVNQKNVHLLSPWESHGLRPPTDVRTIRIRSRGTEGRLGSKAGS